MKELTDEHESSVFKSVLSNNDENDFEKKTVSTNKTRLEGNHDGNGLAESNLDDKREEMFQVNAHTSFLSHHLKPIDMNLIKEQLASSKNLNGSTLANSFSNKTIENNVKSSASNDSVKTTNSHGSQNHGNFFS